MKLSWKTWTYIGGIYPTIQCRSLDPKILKKNAKRYLRKSMKRKNAKSEVLTIGTVCCGHREVAWIQYLFHLLARLQIIPLGTWWIAGILFVETVRSVGRHSIFWITPLPLHHTSPHYELHNVCSPCQFSRKPVVQYQTQHQMCLSMSETCTHRM
jgi:hypothetical protein